MKTLIESTQNSLVFTVQPFFVMSTNKTNNTTNHKLTTAYVNNTVNKQPSQSALTQQQQQLQQLHHQNHHHPSQLPQLQSQHLPKQHSNQTQAQLPSLSASSSSARAQNLQKSLQHTVPPRYQPPPQPPGGILKHIPNSKSGIPTLNHHSPDSNPASHLNIKYPPEVPKLTTIYIPDSVRNTGNPSRIATSRTSQHHRQSLGNGQQQLTPPQQQQQQPSPQSIRLASDEEQQSSGRLQQQEMLKFVRKSESDTVGNSTNANPSTSSNVVRIPASEQNRHFQVTSALPLFIFQHSIQTEMHLFFYFYVLVLNYGITYTQRGKSTS